MLTYLPYFEYPWDRLVIIMHCKCTQFPPITTQGQWSISFDKYQIEFKCKLITYCVNLAFLTSIKMYRVVRCVSPPPPPLVLQELRK